MVRRKKGSIMVFNLSRLADHFASKPFRTIGSVFSGSKKREKVQSQLETAANPLNKKTNGHENDNGNKNGGVHLTGILGC